MPSAESWLYATLLAFCEKRGKELDTGPLACVVIPTKGNEQVEVPIMELQDAEKLEDQG